MSSGEIDTIINRIKKSTGNDEELINDMVKKFKITDLQAKTIINAPLKYLSKHNLARYIERAKNLEQMRDLYINKIRNEHELNEEIKQELKDYKLKYGKKRNTRVISQAEASDIPEGEFKVIITESNFVRKVGLNDDSYYEIASGVSIGEKVITVADEALKDGQKIKIADPKKHKDKNPQKMKKDNKSYVTLSVVSSFKRIGTRNEIKSFFDKIKEIIKTEEKFEEEFSILLIDFYKKYINYEQVKLLIQKLNEVELLFKKHKFYDEYKNLFKEFEVFSEIVELREAGKYFTDKFKEIAICLLPEEQYYPPLDDKKRKFYDTLLPEAEPIWLAENEDNLNVSKKGITKKTFYFDKKYHIRTYKNGIESKGRTYVNGIFYDGNIRPANGWYDDGDTWYFFKDGKKYTGKAKDENGEMYFVKGKYANTYIDGIFYSEGKIANWWCDDGSDWYFFKEGKKFTGEASDNAGKHLFTNV